MAVERALPDAEHIRTLAADNLADQLPTMSCAADDLLDGTALAGKSADRGIGLLAPQIALILQLFRVGQQVRIDRRRADRGSDMRMDLRTASRKAALAFSIRCQRSATWMAFGSALAAASP